MTTLTTTTATTLMMIAMFPEVSKLSQVSKLSTEMKLEWWMQLQHNAIQSALCKCTFIQYIAFYAVNHSFQQKSMKWAFGGTGDIVIEWNVAKTKHNSSSEFKCRTLHSSELQLVPVNLKAEECPLGHLKFDSDIRSNFVVFDCPFFDLEMANRAQWKLQCILFCLFIVAVNFSAKELSTGDIVIEWDIE